MFNVGDTLVLISANGDEPKLFRSVVETTDPLSVIIYNPSSRQTFGVGLPVSLIWRGLTSDSHTTTRIEKVSRYGMSSVVTLAECGWSEFDRRRDTRFGVDLWAEVSVVSETDEGTTFSEVKGRISDISNVGSWFETNETLFPGTLVAVSVQNPDSIDPWRMLAIVTRTSENKNGFALEFFDFLGSTRTSLSQYLSNLEDLAA